MQTHWAGELQASLSVPSSVFPSGLCLLLLLFFSLLLLIYQEKLVLFLVSNSYFYKNGLIYQICENGFKCYCFSVSLFLIRSAAPTFRSDPVICQASPGSTDMVSWHVCDTLRVKL